MGLDWKDWVPYPYKGGKYTCLSDPNYIKDRDKLFKENGNGWWVNEGKGWNPDEKTPMQKAREYRKSRGE
tara:strand:+ start:1375 stop:1584 length:210 start_codon:yes stop_codon:yes gene_type:complete